MNRSECWCPAWVIRCSHVGEYAAIQWGPRNDPNEAPTASGLAMRSTDPELVRLIRAESSGAESSFRSMEAYMWAKVEP